MVTNLDAEFNMNEDLGKTKREIFSLKKSLQIDQREKITPVNCDIIVKAMISFVETLKKTKLDKDTKKEVINALNRCLSKNDLFVITSRWRVRFEIKDKDSFIDMLKKLALIVRWDSYKNRAKLVFLEVAVEEMDMDRYLGFVFRYMWRIVKSVLEQTGREMTVGEFYDGFSRCLPNKHHKEILKRLDTKSGMGSHPEKKKRDLNMKTVEYGKTQKN